MGLALCRPPHSMKMPLYYIIIYTVIMQRPSIALSRLAPGNVSQLAHWGSLVKEKRKFTKFNDPSDPECYTN